MSITVEWMPDEGAYIVRQDSEFIGDFVDLLPACEFALAVSHGFAGSYVEIVAVNADA